MRHRTFRPVRERPSTFARLTASTATVSTATVSMAVIVIAVVAIAMAGGEALGCPNCKDAVNTTDPDGLNLARGYFYSILLMLAMPFTLAGSFGCYVWREMLRQQREQARLGSGNPDRAAGSSVSGAGHMQSAFVEPHP